MRNPGIALAAAAAGLFLLGCDGGGAAEEPGAGTSQAVLDPPTMPRVYENGHPLAVPTDDKAVLLLESEVIRLVNAHRVSQGLNALVDSAELRDAARAHSQHMIDHRFVGHVNPEGLGAGARLTECGVVWSHAGENVAAGYATPQEVFDAWMASPGHKEILESDAWTHTGAGYAADLWPTEAFPYVYYWTQKFLKP
jgi:uncharacterized protein YkwD